MSLSPRTHRSLHMGAKTLGATTGPAVPWKCKRCKLPVNPGRVECDACAELRLEWARDAELDEDQRQSDTEIVL